jgi:hypothetical protein
MNSFSKVAGIVRIIFFEFLLMILLVGFIANLAQDIEQNTVNDDLSYLITTLILGTACLVWLIWTIIKPRRTSEYSVSKSLQVIDFSDFCSTHPSYIFIDAFILLGYAMLFSEFAPTTTLEYYRIVGTWSFAIFIPVFRLFCWYIVGLKYPPEQTEGAWKPVMWFYVIISPFALLMIIGLICNS